MSIIKKKAMIQKVCPQKQNWPSSISKLGSSNKEMLLKYIFKNSQEVQEDSKLRKISSEVNSLDSMPIEEEKEDEKMVQLEFIADNLSCNSLNIGE